MSCASCLTTHSYFSREEGNEIALVAVLGDQPDETMVDQGSKGVATEHIADVQNTTGERFSLGLQEKFTLAFAHDGDKRSRAEGNVKEFSTVDEHVDEKRRRILTSDDSIGIIAKKHQGPS